ncbi:MAG: DUF1732 domain-containing protein [Candidatus Cloacimonetes bacterium]|nr:DUF1732 domain-containing protein [Candidatus Cloacimonadota bacterium]
MNSMTGFGVAEYNKNDIYLRVSLKSLNDKYLNIRTKLPYEFPEYLSYKIEQFIPKFIKRGGINVIVSLKDSRNSVANIDMEDENIKKLLKTLVELKSKTGIEAAVSLSDLMTIQKMESSLIDPFYLNDEFQKLLFDTLNSALEHLIKERKAEGNHLEEFFITSINQIEVSLNTIEHSIPEYLQELKVKVQNICRDITSEDDINLSKFNEEKLLSEINYYIDKSDITEEIVRLKSHLKKLRNLINVNGKPIGLSMLFMIQEMQREISTISAKYHNATIFPDIINIKEEIEKCKEQALNVE